MKCWEFGRTVRRWRDRVPPDAVGLPSGGRRRASGLRREELAGLAGISTDYLTRLEQGRATSPSAQVVEALARALRLADPERDPLFELAGHAAPGPDVVPSRVTPSVQRLMDRMSDTPLAVFDATWTLVAANALYDALMGATSTWRGLERNALWRGFVSPGNRVVHSADEEVRLRVGQVADLRRTAARYPADRQLRRLIHELATHSPRFAGLWEREDLARWRRIGSRPSARSSNIPASARSPSTATFSSWLTMTCGSWSIPPSPEHRTPSVLRWRSSWGSSSWWSDPGPHGPRTTRRLPRVTAPAETRCMTQSLSHDSTVPDRAWIVTGPTSGIGRRTTLELTPCGTLVLVGRDSTRLTALREEIAARGGRAFQVVADFADLHSVRRAAAEIVALDLPLVGLLNNAGMAAVHDGDLSAQGWDLTYATNHLGPFAFTEALVPHLPDGAHVVFVCSGVEDPERRPAVAAGFRGARYLSAEAGARGQWAPGGAKRPSMDAYATSKQGNLATVLAFARETPRLRFNAVEPGFSPGSDLGRDAGPVLRFISRWVLSPVAPMIKYWSTPQRAGRMIVRVLTDDSGSTGVYYDETGRSMRGSTQVHDPAFNGRVVAETRALLATIPLDG